MIYAQKFERTNFNFKPGLTESVWVIVETKFAPDADCALERYEMDAYDALWAQYPLWNCPYHQGNPPPNRFENIRHGFSSVFIREHRKLS